MKNWIRRGGIVALLILTVLIGAIWWVLSGWLLKTTIEHVGTRMVGAKVEVESADLTFTPLGFEISRLQITDPEQPMQNLIELKSATGNLAFLPLLIGQVIVEELSAREVQFYSKRETSGALKDTGVGEAEPEADITERLTSVGEKLPSVEEILEKEPLQTVQQINQLEQQVNEQQAELLKNIESLPDEQTIKDYERRVNELKETEIKNVEDLRRLQQELKKLKQDIEQDRELIEKTRNQLKMAKQELTNQLKAVNQAKQNDIEQIKSKYGLDLTGAGNAIRLLFGDAAQKWVHTLTIAGGLIQRVLPSGEQVPRPVQPQREDGRFIHFTDATPLPSFLIRRAYFSVLLGLGQFELNVEDATHEPHIYGKPMRFFAMSQQLADANQIKLDGVFNHVNPQNAIDTMEWSVSGWRITDAIISQASELSLKLEESLADLTGKATLLDAKSLQASFKAGFENAKWSGEATEDWVQRIIDALSSAEEFKITGQVTGEVESPEISLNSNLDQQLKQAVASEFQATQNELEQKLETQLSTKVEKGLVPYNEQLAFLNQKDATLQEQSTRLEALLEAELESVVDSKKDEVTDKLKDKLKDFRF